MSVVISTRIAHPPASAETRARAVLYVLSAVSLALGVFAAVGSGEWLTSATILLAILVVAMTLPLAGLAFVVAILLPFQFYFPLPDSSFTLRAAALIVLFACPRLLITRPALLKHPPVWIFPASLFLIAAFLSALGAQDRYAALRGIYDWLVAFTTAFLVGGTLQSEGSARDGTRVKPVVQPDTSAGAVAHTPSRFSETSKVSPQRHMVSILAAALVAVGVLQAGIGLAEYVLGLERVLHLLRLPIAAMFFQPDLLAEKLTALSFNWIEPDRILPFGTYLNAIDYAIFLAASLCLALALLVWLEGSRPAGLTARRGDLQGRDWLRVFVLLAGICFLGAALALVLKGSGWLAFLGGAAVLVWSLLPRLSARTIGLCLLVAVALVFALPFGNAIVERAAYLVQREQGTFGTAGRLEIWASVIRSLSQRPLFGYGLNNGILLTEPMRTLAGGALAFNVTSVESSYVAALVETGIVGFGALAMLLGVVLARGYRNARADQNVLHAGILAALVALLVGNLTVTGLAAEQNGMLLGVLIGIVFGQPNDD